MESDTHPESPRLSLNRQDLVALGNALNEVLRGPMQIGEWEFHARIGVDREYALELHQRLKQAPRRSTP
jgi:hypothetical protein